MMCQAYSFSLQKWYKKARKLTEIKESLKDFTTVIEK